MQSPDEQLKQCTQFVITYAPECAKEFVKEESGIKDKQRYIPKAMALLAYIKNTKERRAMVDHILSRVAIHALTIA